NIVAAEDQGLRALVPLPDFDARTPYYGKSTFIYDPEHDIYRCPEGAVLSRRKVNRAEGTVVYRADAAACNACPVKAACTRSNQGRSVHRSTRPTWSGCAVSTARPRISGRSPPVRISSVCCSRRAGLIYHRVIRRPQLMSG